jgi:uncharacterized membrane protein
MYGELWEWWGISVCLSEIVFVFVFVIVFVFGLKFKLQTVQRKKKQRKRIQKKKTNKTPNVLFPTVQESASQRFVGRPV